MIHIFSSLLAGFILTLSLNAAEPQADWRGDYAIAEGFRIQRDTTGYKLPSAIAFVPQPGPNPKDPLYFVTELRGVLKVVTNDRTVLTFAEGFQHLVPQKELPDHLGEIGMAGICLEPEHGYVFVSYAYEDKDGVYRNAIMRFETTPRIFAVKPTKQTRIAPVLDGFISNLAHQIGPMAAVGGNLFVNVGDRFSAAESRDLDFPSGKVLRMTYDGLPLPDNPFATDADPQRVRNYVWALGLRNPFSLSAVKGRLFAAENGVDIDRFMEIKRGADYLYSGDSDDSGANALYVWSPAVSPVQLNYDLAGDGTATFPEIWRNKFFLALSGSPLDEPGPDHRRKRVVSIGVDFETGFLSQTPREFMRYAGSQRQLIVGVAAGHDGLYVVNMFPDAEGVTAILHIDYKPESAHPKVVLKPKTPQDIVQAKCYICHKIDGLGMGSAAPTISRLKLAGQILQQIESPAYETQLAAIDAMTTEPFIKFRKARDEVRAASGQEKARLWVKNRLLEPRFDRTIVAMPNLGLTEEEAETMSKWLVEPSSVENVKLHLRPVFGYYLKEKTGLFSAGAAAGIILAFATAKFWRWRRRRRAAEADISP